MSPHNVGHGLATETIMSAMRLTALPRRERRRAEDAGPPPPVPPFVTLSRQSGCGGRAFAAALVELLNERDPAPQPWTVWDRELVERVAQDHHLNARFVESLEDSSRTWLDEFLGGFSAGGTGPEEVAVYHRVAQTIRALAQVGRVVIVGRGATFVTRNMVGGVHVRLVAPLSHRIARTAAEYGVTTDSAERRVRSIDRARETFHARHGFAGSMAPDAFSIVLNTAAADVPALAQCVLPLVGTARSTLTAIAATADLSKSR